jgi:hypothetical protein
MSKTLANLPPDIQSSILGYVLEEVNVFVTENGKANDLKAFLETSGFKNILSKTENGLTTVTAQKEQVFPEKVVFDESVSSDYVTCNPSQVPNNKDCGTITDQETCTSSYQGGSCSNGCTGNSAQLNCFWNDNGTCSDGGGACTEDTCDCPLV